MQLTFNKHSALKIMRFLRVNGGNGGDPWRRSDILGPDPSPRQRWTVQLFQDLELGFDFLDENGETWIAVPKDARRIRTRGTRCTTYAGGMPGESFIRVADGIAISGPELLFAELAEHMNPIEHLMLGLELCGTFSRDFSDPFNGPVVYGVKPLTSAQRIQEFATRAKKVKGIQAARKSAAYVMDNAWSPVEALIAAVLRLPVDSLGYDLGRLSLNPRVEKGCDLPGARKSRVPDIMVRDTPVGVNYDGLAHLDLESIARAAIDVGMNPGVSRNQAVLLRAVRDVRLKAVDDIRRNRELATHGFAVFPMVMEDLYVPGGMDAMVAQLIAAIEDCSNRDMTAQKRHLRKQELSDARYRLMLSLLPGNHARNVNVGRFIQGFKVSESVGKSEECFVAF